MDTSQAADVPAEKVPAEDVARVRAFNRFLTGRMGIVRPDHLGSPWSLTDVRVMYELLHLGRTETSALRGLLEMDAGQLSRVLARMEDGGLVSRAPSPDDGRKQTVELTAAGERAAAMMDGRADLQIRDLLSGIGGGDRERLLSAMETVRRVLGADGTDGGGRVVLRGPRPGDLGWVVERHGDLYWREYGFDSGFEALVAGIVAGYVRDRDPARDNAWIAELDGERAGAVFCMRADPAGGETAKLRLLLVEPWARGHGIGRLLTDECLAFARAAGYRRMTLWTQSVLTAARHIYGKAGFTLTASEPHHSFGRDLVAETWERELAPVR
ncbi:helix-turn-helix domain-containing GNAT family N-acetyltransferase [Nocardiopsis sp. RSe5-2]|uniref:Helix-turn-helix domain-containing GNAT family N-acetyltransferase n=1 Tax=Nocardiopsis endophytica TaxID=3018445 RepID=A0ABT4TXX1_9ACTN|nr:helix-turn-helix domain-containing GNAT family N-acetyltransferase [Nocardiopsis endophytica]MDA2809271.1 helix-turn-helix domain-containing GNAT family N-acetyltransferase [Nocardiopsis endophytica]